MGLTETVITAREFVQDVFLRSKSKAVENNVKNAINSFEKFCIESYEKDIVNTIKSIKKQELDPYQVLKNFVTYLMKIKNKSNTISVKLSYARQYMIDNDIEINPYKMRSKVKLPRDYLEKRQPLTTDIISVILNILPLDVKVLGLMIISTLRRPQELLQLRVRDVNFESCPAIVNIAATISKNKVAKTTFLTEECKNMLSKYLGNRVNRLDDLIFPSIRNAKNPSIAANYFAKRFRYNMHKMPELNNRKDSTPNRFKISLYSLKDFAFTRVSKKWDLDFAKELKGDKTTEYSNYTDDEKMEMYLECEPYLTIFNADKLRKELDIKYQTQQKEIEELRKQKEEEREAWELRYSRLEKMVNEAVQEGTKFKLLHKGKKVIMVDEDTGLVDKIEKLLAEQKEG